MENKFYLLFGVAFIAIGVFVFYASNSFSGQAEREATMMKDIEGLQRSVAPAAGNETPAVQTAAPPAQAVPTTLSMTASILSIISGILSILKFVKETFLAKK